MTINDLLIKLTALKEQHNFIGNQLIRVADENRDGRESDIDDVQVTSNYGEGTYVVLVI